MTSKTEYKALKMLRSVELTGDMETEHLHKLASLAREVEFLEGEIIYCRGDMGKAVYLIEEGEVVIETDVPGQGPVTLNFLGPGQFFGWSSLFPSERKMASTRALEPTRAIAIVASQLRAAWQVDHYLENAIIRRAGRDMINRIKAMRRQLVDMLASPMANDYPTSSSRG
jgi:CRP-like cAMP-binding protein